jgi:hypothetical protein
VDLAIGIDYGHTSVAVGDRVTLSSTGRWRSRRPASYGLPPWRARRRTATPDRSSAPPIPTGCPRAGPREHRARAPMPPAVRLDGS